MLNRICQGEWKEDCIILGVPYRNAKGEAEFSFQAIKDTKENKETWIIVNFIERKQRVVYEGGLSKIDSLRNEIQILNSEYLEWVERLMKKWMKEGD